MIYFSLIPLLYFFTTKTESDNGSCQNNGTNITHSNSLEEFTTNTFEYTNTSQYKITTR